MESLITVIMHPIPTAVSVMTVIIVLSLCVILFSLDEEGLDYGDDDYYYTRNSP